MKKTCRDSTTWAMWVVLLGLALVLGPNLGLAQEADDLISVSADESGDAPGGELMGEGAAEAEHEPNEAFVDESADEDAGELANEPGKESAEGAVEPMNEAATEPVNETVNPPAGRSRDRSRDRMAERPDERPMGRSRGRLRSSFGDEGAGAPASSSGQLGEAYVIITRNNMFSRTRRPWRPEPERQQVMKPVVNPESYYILRGIVRENDTFIAFLQDNRQGGVLQLREGDKVARGTIKSITLDSIEYQFEDRTITVTFGQDLEGGQGALSLDDMAQWSPGPSSSGQTSSPSSEPLTGDDAELLRRLMERRQQQLGQ